MTEGSGLRLVLGQELGGRLEHWNYDTWKTVPDMEWVDPVLRPVRGGCAGPRERLSPIGGLGDSEDARARFQKTETQAPRQK